MSLGTPTAVLLVIFFLIPGFLWKRTAEVLSRYAKPRKTELLEYVTLSCFNYLFASPIICALLVKWPAGLELGKLGTLRTHIPYVGWWLLLIFLLPVAAGIATACLARMRVLRTFLSRFGLSVIHPAPTAWDYAFARNESYWARIQLTDGGYMEGVFDSSSLASSVPGERDVFLEAAYEWDESARQYIAVEGNQGVWVNAASIQTITFMRLRSTSAEDVPVNSESSYWPCRLLQRFVELMRTASERFCQWPTSRIMTTRIMATKPGRRTSASRRATSRSAGQSTRSAHPRNHPRSRNGVCDHFSWQERSSHTQQ